MCFVTTYDGIHHFSMLRLRSDNFFKSLRCASYPTRQRILLRSLWLGCCVLEGNFTLRHALQVEMVLPLLSRDLLLAHGLTRNQGLASVLFDVLGCRHGTSQDGAAIRLLNLYGL